tara:strand:+ start:4047 stop:5042 length:996 start_codon:yes stop_codon:yes gene_type:complete
MEAAPLPEQPNRRVAIVDCGSNTFSMLIVDAKENRWEEQFMMRHPVFLGQGGFKQASIMPDRFAKGIDSLRIMKQATVNFAVDEVRVVATSVLRDAMNGPEFCAKAEEMTGWKMEIISGDQEAHWIHKGVAMTTTQLPEKHVIMDIGGGSLEFIVAEMKVSGEKSEILWKQSFDAGVARLEDFGKPTDPLTQAGVGRYAAFLSYTLAPLQEALKKHQPEILVGSSGSFDTFLDLVKGGVAPTYVAPLSSEWGHPYAEKINRTGLMALHDTLINSDLQKRLEMPGMAPPRARMIPLASLLIQQVLDWMPENAIIMRSAYALREGVLCDTLDL